MTAATATSKTTPSTMTATTTTTAGLKHRAKGLPSINHSLSLSGGDFSDEFNDFFSSFRLKLNSFKFFDPQRLCLVRAGMRTQAFLILTTAKTTGLPILTGEDKKSRRNTIVQASIK